MENTVEQGDVLSSRILQAEELLVRCDRIPLMSHKSTVSKAQLVNRIKSELRFLNRLVTGCEHLKPDHLQSSNLIHLASVVDCCLSVSALVHTLKRFTFNDGLQEKCLVVDVICDYGKTWIKVIARSPSSLLCMTSGAAKYGQKSLIDQLKEIIQCANQNPCMYVVPKVKVWFSRGIVDGLQEYLKDIDVELFGPDFKGKISLQDALKTSEPKCSKNLSKPLSSREPTKNLDSPACSAADTAVSVKSNAYCYENSVQDYYENLKLFPCIIARNENLLNLDVSCMIAQVSNLTNGHCNAAFQEDILCEQAQRERISSVRNVFSNLFEGKKLVCCESAFASFKDIISCVGGTEEKERASEFLTQLTIIPDHPSRRAVNLQESGRVKERSKVIFGTGDFCEAVTVTANFGFLRAALSQGVNFVAFVHESRALSEMKEEPVLSETTAL